MTLKINAMTAMPIIKAICDFYDGHYDEL